MVCVNIPQAKEGAMRFKERSNISAGEVHAYAMDWLMQARVMKDHGWKCTAAVVLNVLLRAAAGARSISAACRDLARAPSDHAIMTALDRGLPKTLLALENRLNAALTGQLPRPWRRRTWQVAIDWHLTPYYGQPCASANELYYGPREHGTQQFHAYASACIVESGRRYTVALTWARRHEPAAVVLERLVARMDRLGLKKRAVLLDRHFFTVNVIAYLQQRRLPFLMPVMFRGRRPKKGSKPRGLAAIKRNKAGWYKHVLKGAGGQVDVSVCVGYRTHKNRKDGKHVQQKLLFAAWRVKGSPTEIRNRYRQRFGIETSFRQLRQARIVTTTRNPRLRLLFIAVALVLRNLWAWLHAERLADGPPDRPTLRLGLLRLRQMLDWIVYQIVQLLHDGSPPSLTWIAA
jgi:hypothetical protein